MIRRLRDLLEAADRDREVAGVVVTGAGPAFSGGVDLSFFATATPESVHVLIESLRDLCAAARTIRKPVACAIRGACVGGALELAVAADIRVCAPDARFGMPEVAIGIPSVIDAALLVPTIGLGRARELLLTGDLVDAPTALAWGLVNRVADDPVAESAALLGRITRHAPYAVRAQKQLVDDWLNAPLDESIEDSIPLLVDAFRDGSPQRIAGERLRRP